MTAKDALLALGSELERAFDTQWTTLAGDLPRPVPSYRFAVDRNWKFDRAWPDHLLAVELEGGAYGRKVVCHNCGATVRAITSRGAGAEVRAAGWHGHQSRFMADREKYNVAALQGWLLLRFVNEDVVSEPFAMIETIRQALENRAWRIRIGEALTAHQTRMLEMIAAGLTTPEIAQRLNVTVPSARAQAVTLLSRLHAPNRPSAVARGFAWGLLDASRIPWEWSEVTLGRKEGSE